MSKLKSYHFSLGNSSVGPVGFCARIEATSAKKAVEQLKEVLENMNQEHDVAKAAGLRGETDLGVDYLEVYFNVDAISEKDIDEINPVDEKAAS